MSISIIINPGSGPVKNATLENAVANIKHFVADCEKQSKIKGIKYRRDARLDDSGRFGFIVYRGKVIHQIEMPGLPLEQVRYVGAKAQNIWDFPRLYVDGSSWVWKFAVLKRKANWIPDKNGVVES